MQNVLAENLISPVSIFISGQANPQPGIPELEVPQSGNLIKILAKSVNSF